MTVVTSTDPRTGRVVETVADETTAAEVDQLCQAAANAELPDPRPARARIVAVGGRRAGGRPGHDRRPRRPGDRPGRAAAERRTDPVLLPVPPVRGTKPGLAFVPAGPAGDRLRAAAAAAFGQSGSLVALNEGIQHGYDAGTGRLAEHPGLFPIAAGGAPAGLGFQLRPVLLGTDTGHVDESLARECFGPETILVSYSDEQDLLAALAKLPGSLAAAVHLTDADDVTAILDVLRPKAGRLLFNGFPTGVAVAWAQHHGGPWPATNTLHTSVGITSIRRFLRPVAWQDAPQRLLPAELRDDPGEAAVPRRVDGRLVP